VQSNFIQKKFAPKILMKLTPGQLLLVVVVQFIILEVKILLDLNSLAFFAIQYRRKTISTSSYLTNIISASKRLNEGLLL